MTIHNPPRNITTKPNPMTGERHNSPTNSLIILLAGVPGVGKTTLGNALLGELGLTHHISTGFLRATMDLYLPDEQSALLRKRAFDAYELLNGIALTRHGNELVEKSRRRKRTQVLKIIGMELETRESHTLEEIMNEIVWKVMKRYELPHIVIKTAEFDFKTDTLSLSSFSHFLPFGLNFPHHLITHTESRARRGFAFLLYIGFR